MAISNRAPPKSWTLAEVWAAQERFLSSGGKDGPTAPLCRWVALQRLDELRVAFNAGDLYALMLAIRLCASHELALPRWVADAYIAAFDRVHNYRAKSWNDVFGDPLPKGGTRKLASLRKRREKSSFVINEVRRRSKHEPIDDALFESVGRKLGIGRTLTADYHARAVRWGKDFMNSGGIYGTVVRALLEPYRAPGLPPRKQRH